MGKLRQNQINQVVQHLETLDKWVVYGAIKTGPKSLESMAAMAPAPFLETWRWLHRCSPEISAGSVTEKNAVSHSHDGSMYGIYMYIC